jgi:hypothetical protein
MLRSWDNERKDLLGNFHHLFQWETAVIITELALKGLTKIELTKIELDKQPESEKNVKEVERMKREPYRGV